MKISDKVVVITGASSGIGMALAFQVAAKGGRVVLAARQDRLIQDHARAIQERGGRAIAVATDVSERSQVDRLIQKTIDTFGRIDILINNAGTSPGKGIILEQSEAQVRATMEVNFMGGLYGLWAAAPHMEKNGGGQIVFITSIIGKRGIPRNAAYCASKFAMQGLAESVRPELKRKNIRILTICPAGVDTAFYANNGKATDRGYYLHPVEKIARLVIRACEREKREDLLTWDAKLMNVLNFFFPKLMDWAIGKAKGV